MRVGLASFECRNRDVAFNLSQIERAMREAQGKIDLLCFGEAYLQGFDCLCWDYEADREVAAEPASEPVRRLCAWSREYGVALLTGYIERENGRALPGGGQHGRIYLPGPQDQARFVRGHVGVPGAVQDGGFADLAGLCQFHAGGVGGRGAGGLRPAGRPGGGARFDGQSHRPPALQSRRRVPLFQRGGAGPACV